MTTLANKLPRKRSSSSEPPPQPRKPKLSLPTISGTTSPSELLLTTAWSTLRLLLHSWITSHLYVGTENFLPHWPSEMIHQYPVLILRLSILAVLFVTDAITKSMSNTCSWKSRTAFEYYLVHYANGKAVANTSNASVVSGGSSATYTEPTRQPTRATGRPEGRQVAEREPTKSFSRVVVPPLFAATTQLTEDG